MTLMPVILSGGAGARLWPLSRRDRPKPFATMPDGSMPAAATYARAASLEGVEHIITVTGREFAFMTAEAIRAAEAPARAHTLLLEPQARNTAPAVALAALHAALVDGDDTMLLVLPADHRICDEAAFAAAVAQAAALAQGGRIVTFGVLPDRAEAGYGYIEVEDERVVGFVEKPDAATAAAWVSGGRHRWNSGMFCFAARTMIAAMAIHCPDLLDAASRALRQAKGGRADGFETVEAAPEPYALAPAISLDHAVMEKVAASLLACVPLACGWSDIGSWPAVAELLPLDAAGNRVAGEVIAEAASDCFVAAGQRLVALAGVRGLIVVDTPDALLIAAADSADDARRIYARLRENGHPAARLGGGVGRSKI